MPSSASCTLVGTESFETVRLRTAVLKFLLMNYSKAQLEVMSGDVDSIKFEVLDRIKNSSSATWRLLHDYSPNQGCHVSFIRYVLQEVLPQILAEGTTGVLEDSMSAS